MSCQHTTWADCLCAIAALGGKRVSFCERIALFPQPAFVYQEAWLDEMRRVGGRAHCPVCTLTYDEHPRHPDYPHIPTLVVSCNGEALKT